MNWRRGTIPTREFVEVMRDHWTRRLGNVSSRRLERTWGLICDTFNDHIEADDDTKRACVWPVLSPPTGTGKTEGTIIYCSLLSRLIPQGCHPGVVVITRRKKEADNIAEKINRYSLQYSPSLTGKAIAVSYHTDNKKLHRLEDLRTFPVLVITHRAYEIALDVLGSDSTIPKTWDFFQTFGSGTRKLRIIDEAIDLVEESSVDADCVEWILEILKRLAPEMQERFENEIAGLDAMADLFRKLREQTAGKYSPDRMLFKVPIVKSGMVDERQCVTPDFIALRDALKDVPLDRIKAFKDDPLENQRLHAILDSILRSIDAVTKSWLWYSKMEGAKDTLLTARVLIPENAKGAIILDATATSNIVYKLYPDFRVLDLITGTRSYQNVTLNVSRGHRTGKGFMVKNAKELSEQLIADLEGRLNGANALVVTHKKVKPSLSGFKPENFKMTLAHWGAIDGSNDWRECDTAVIFGLPWRPDTWPANTYFAFQGPQDTEWLLPDGDRRHGEHDDIKASIEIGQIVTDVIQAINRTRSRTVVDKKGNCPPVAVYLMLPKGDNGDKILNGISSAMPGIDVREWDYNGQKRKVRRTEHEQPLIDFILGMDAGRKAAGTIQRLLRIPRSNFKRYIERITGKHSVTAQREGVSGKSEDSSRGDNKAAPSAASPPDEDPLIQAMESAGVFYETGGRGRTAYFVKPL